MQMFAGQSALLWREKWNSREVWSPSIRVDIPMMFCILFCFASLFSSFIPDPFKILLIFNAAIFLRAFKAVGFLLFMFNDSSQYLHRPILHVFAVCRELMSSFQILSRRRGGVDGLCYWYSSFTSVVWVFLLPQRGAKARSANSWCVFLQLHGYTPMFNHCL